MPSGKRISERTRNEIIRLSRLRNADGLPMWNCSQIAAELGLYHMTVIRILRKHREAHDTLRTIPGR